MLNIFNEDYKVQIESPKSVYVTNKNTGNSDFMTLEKFSNNFRLESFVVDLDAMKPEELLAWYIVKTHPNYQSFN